MAVIRAELDCLRTALLFSLLTAPLDFAGREPLWMAREDLRAQLA